MANDDGGYMYVHGLRQIALILPLTGRSHDTVVGRVDFLLGSRQGQGERGVKVMTTSGNVKIDFLVASVHEYVGK
jgi:hypothetical protein